MEKSNNCKDCEEMRYQDGTAWCRKKILSTKDGQPIRFDLSSTGIKNLDRLIQPMWSRAKSCNRFNSMLD